MIMENAKFEVNVKAGYSDVDFQFDNYDDALQFADLAMKNVKPYVNSTGEEMESIVTISMIPIELKKEDNDNELAVQA